MGIPMLESGIQALILCGPGTSFGTLLDQEQTPKCLALIANRPMVYYPLYFCQRAEIEDITLITPPSALAHIEAALERNPYLASLPRPKVLAPQDLEATTATAQLLRLPEVQSCIKTDFFLLPCDLVCELDGKYLLQTWLASQIQKPHGTERDRQGGLCVYYQPEDVVKDEILDLIAVTPLRQTEVSAKSNHGLSRLLMSIGVDMVKRKLDKNKDFLLRHSFAKRQAKAKILTGYRDAHLYAFPYWVKDLVCHRRLVSVSEDIIGLWAKSTWQRGLGEKLGLDIYSDQQNEKRTNDYRDMSTTVHRSPYTDALGIPPLLAYLQTGSTPLVRRVDSPALLLSTSLRLAKLESIEAVGDAANPPPLAHNSKITSPEGINPRCFISAADCLLGADVIVEEKCAIKESCIGPNSKICSGARLTRCVVMDNAVIGERCVLTGCIVGSRSTIGRNSVLRDCEVQEGNVVPEKTEAKDEKFMPLFQDLEQDDVECLEDNSTD